MPVLYAVGGTALTVLLAGPHPAEPLVAARDALRPVRAAAVSRRAARVRLTPVGIEVRGLRTRVHPYADVASVEVAPDWDGGHAVWVRLRSSVASAEPEVLTPPPGWTRTSGRTLADVVDAIRAAGRGRLARPRDGPRYAVGASCVAPGETNWGRTPIALDPPEITEP